MRVPAVVLAAITVVPAWSHDVITTRLTWSKEISRIVYKRCASCHFDGGPSVSLLTYAEARPWAKAIKEEVLARRMPPWGAVKGFGELKDDPSLTQDDLDRIAQWVEGGAPEGDAKYMPPQPIAPESQRPSFRRVPLKAGLTLIGLAPAADVPDARISAELPDGRVVPLLWLHEYKGAWKRTFLFTGPVQVPTRARIRVEPPVAIDALIAAPRPPR